jgi:hypothetical protein
MTRFYFITWGGILPSWIINLVAAFQASHSQTSITWWNWFPCLLFTKSISSGSQYVIMQSKIGWRKVKLRQIGLGKWFWLSIVHRLRWLVKGTATLCTGWKDYNKYDVTAFLFFWLAHHNDSSRWFAKPSVGSLPLMLNLLWDDRHLCHMKKMEKNNTGTHVLSTAESIRACPTAAINWPFGTFWMKMYRRTQWIFFGAGEIAHIQSALQRICARKSLFLSIKWLSHWPTTMIGPGGES